MDENKAAKLAAAALQNAMPLNRGGVLFRHALSSGLPAARFRVQEEVGKTFRLEEFVFRLRIGERDAERV